MAQEQKITQSPNGAVTIPQGGIPVITMNAAYIDFVGMAVNFLRCGCPQVQLVDVWNTERFDKPALEALNVGIKMLAVDGETLEVVAFPALFPVITIKREVIKTK
jgi:hypothetical protein